MIWSFVADREDLIEIQRVAKLYNLRFENNPAVLYNLGHKRIFVSLNFDGAENQSSAVQEIDFILQREQHQETWEKNVSFLRKIKKLFVHLLLKKD
jgi:hypothetical protein